MNWVVMHMAGKLVIGEDPDTEVEEARFPDPAKEKPVGKPGRLDCRGCIHMPVCAIFRAVTSAVQQFREGTGADSTTPVQPFGIANSCEAYLEGPARIEVVVGKKGARA